MPDIKRLSDEELRQQYLQSLSDDELRALNGKGVGSDIRKRSRGGFDPREVNRQKPPEDDPVVKRGNLLPLGRTKSGRLVPALPEPFMAGGRAVGTAIQGKQPLMSDVGPAASLGITNSPGVPPINGRFLVTPGRQGTTTGGEVYSKPLPRPEVPSTEQLGATKTAAYGASEAAGVTVDAGKFGAFASKISDALVGQRRLNKGVAPQGLGLIDMMNGVAADAGQGKAVSLHDLDLLRQNANDVLDSNSATGSDKRVARLVIGAVDKFINDDGNFAGGDTATGRAKLKEARTAAFKEFKAKEIDGMIRTAYKKAEKSGNVEKELINIFSKLYQNDKRFDRFSAEEKAAIQNAARGGGVKLLSVLGRFSPGLHGGLAGTLANIGTGGGLIELFHDPAVGLAIMGGMTASKLASFAATRTAERAAKGVADLVKGGRAVSDYRMQNMMRTRARAGQMQRLGIMGGGGLLGPQGGAPQQQDFNPLLNPNQT